MKRLTLLLSCAACGASPSAAHDAGVDATAFVAVNGGTIQLDAPCGYTVTTRTNAEAPVAVADGTGTNGSDPTAKDVHLGLAHDPSSSIVVDWRTNDDQTTVTTVQYGVASTSETTVSGFEFGYLSNYSLQSPRIRMHEVHICGLAADTTYKYRVGGKGSDGMEHWSPEYTFRTAPDLTKDPSASVTVAVLGDTRDGYADWGAILAKVEAQATPDVYLFTGDAITLGQVQSEWDTFWDDASPVLSHAPTLFAHGNHEANTINYYSQVALPGNESWYSIDYGPFHLTVLNDTPDDPAQITGDETTFLSSDLAANQAAPWKLVMHHQALWSAAIGHGSNTTLRGEWGPIYDQYAVDLVLNGHDHNYERSLPMTGETVAASGGTTYIVAGSAGAVLYDSGTGFWTATSKSVENYVVLTVRVGSLSGQAFDSTGTMIDSFSLTKP